MVTNLIRSILIYNHIIKWYLFKNQGLGCDELFIIIKLDTNVNKKIISKLNSQVFKADFILNKFLLYLANKYY